MATPTFTKTPLPAKTVTYGFEKNIDPETIWHSSTMTMTMETKTKMVAKTKLYVLRARNSETGESSDVKALLTESEAIQEIKSFGEWFENLSIVHKILITERFVKGHRLSPERKALVAIYPWGAHALVTADEIGIVALEFDSESEANMEMLVITSEAGIRNTKKLREMYE